MFLGQRRRECNPKNCCQEDQFQAAKIQQSWKFLTTTTKYTVSEGNLQSVSQGESCLLSTAPIAGDEFLAVWTAGPREMQMVAGQVSKQDFYVT